MLIVSQIPSESFVLPSGGNAAVFFTVSKANELVEMASHNPEFVLFAEELVWQIAENDKLSEANAIYAWVKENMRYVTDPTSTEKLLNPVLAVQLFKDGKPLSGDCDCSALLIASLMQAVGIPTRFRVVKLRPDPAHYRHIYVDAFLNNRWVTYDAAQAASTPGFSLSSTQQIGSPAFVGMSNGMSGIKEDIQSIWSGGTVPEWFKTIQTAINAVPGGEQKVSMATKALAWVQYPGTWILTAGLLIMIYVAGRRR